jgi:hypothetical protein
MKLEYAGDAGVFLAPKVYAIKNLDGSGKDLIKVKGSKKGHGLTFKDFEGLLHKETMKVINQEKWYRMFQRGTINIKKVLYTLKVTENKRALVYRDKIFVYTKPFVL